MKYQNGTTATQHMRDTVRRRELLAALAGGAVGGTAISSAGPLSVSGREGRSESQTRGDLAWTRTHLDDDTRFTAANTAVEAAGDGYLVAGRQATGERGTAAWVGSFDGDGRYQWGRRYDGGVRGRIETVVANDDGTYVLAGGRTSGDTTGGWAATVAADGTIQWEERYRSVAVIRDATATEDGYLLIGASPGGHLWVGAIDADGTIEWQRTERGHRGYAVVPDDDGGYLFVGAEPGDDRHPRPWIASVVDTGRRRWERSYGTRALAYDLVPTDDGFFLAGLSRGPGAATAAGYVAKLDRNGHQRWHRTYGPNDRNILFSVTTVDDTALVGGWTGVESTGDAWLVAVDGAGDRQWDRTYDAGAWDRFNDLVRTDDGVLLPGGSGTAALLGLYDPSAQSPGASTPPAGSSADTTTIDGGSASASGGQRARTDRPSTGAGTAVRSAADDVGRGTTTGSGPGLGIASALAGLGSGAATLWARRRTDEN